jgi:hypothetical protein
MIVAVTAGISLAGTGPLAEALANKPWSNTLREFLDKNLDLLMKWSRQAGTITQPTPRDDYVAYRDHLLEKYGTYRDWSTKLTQEEKDEYFERFMKNQEEIDAQNAKKSLTDWEAELKIPQDPKCESEQMQRIIWDSVKNDMKKGEIFDAGAEYRNRLMRQLDHDNPPDNITKVDDRYKRTSTSRRG